MADDCPERLRNLPEFVHYVLTTARSHRANIARLAAGAQCPVLHVTSNADEASLVEELRLLFATKDV